MNATWQELTSWNLVCHRSMATLDQTDWGLQLLAFAWDEYLVKFVQTSGNSLDGDDKKLPIGEE